MCGIGDVDGYTHRAQTPRESNQRRDKRTRVEMSGEKGTIWDIKKKEKGGT